MDIFILGWIALNIWFWDYNNIPVTDFINAHPFCTLFILELLFYESNSKNRKLITEGLNNKKDETD